MTASKILFDGKHAFIAIFRTASHTKMPTVDVKALALLSTRQRGKLKWFARNLMFVTAFAKPAAKNTESTEVVPSGRFIVVIVVVIKAIIIVVIIIIIAIIIVIVIIIVIAIMAIPRFWRSS